MASAIDFQGLLQAEKKRAREAKKNKQQSGANYSGTPEEPKKAGSSNVISSRISANGRTSISSTSSASNPIASSDPPDDTWQRIISSPPSFDPSKHIIMTTQSVYYVPEYLPDEYSSKLKNWLLSLPERFDDGSTEDQISESAPCWTKLRHSQRRVALFDGRKLSLPAPLAAISRSLVGSGAFPSTEPPNHVLVNDYNAGEGIMPHTDGPSYLDRTATISIGGDVILKFRKRLSAHEIGQSSTSAEKREEEGLDLLLSGGGSLVVFAGAIYSHYLHSIDEVNSEVTTSVCGNAEAGIPVKRAHRISLTFRHKFKESTT
mmetsp:Transcript_27929/g.61304  ORF Transcript_27929/g.61304 Transcript_27929/m.61304 type:complete len:318 (+) Transcript_27929:61-1014(+)